MMRYNLEAMRGKVSDDGIYKIELEIGQVVIWGRLQAIPGCHFVDREISICARSPQLGKILTSLGFHLPMYPSISLDDRQKLEAIKRLGIQNLYASDHNDNTTFRMWPRSPSKGGSSGKGGIGGCWYMKDLLSSDIVKYINEHDKVSVDELLSF